jgi:hypothetical protein
VILDVVDSSGPHLIYARRTKEPRLALFGRNMQCQTPLFYVHRDGLITLNAEPGASSISLVRRTPYRRLVSEPISVSRSVAELIRRLSCDPVRDADGQIEGVGLSYSQVVQTIQGLCEQGAINADFRIEGTVLTDPWLQEEPLLGRKEAEFE